MLPANRPQMEQLSRLSTEAGLVQEEAWSQCRS